MKSYCSDKIRGVTRFSRMILCMIAVPWCLASCGGGGESQTTVVSDQSTQWVTITSISTSTTSAYLSGTAWISKSWVGLHCAGIACLFDESYDNYPGVDVTCTNLTTGAPGTAVSYYGGGTGWKHEWWAAVPIVYGNNRIRVSAFDPDGKGGSATVDVMN